MKYTRHILTVEWEDIITQDLFGFLKVTDLPLELVTLRRIYVSLGYLCGSLLLVCFLCLVHWEHILGH